MSTRAHIRIHSDSHIVCLYHHHDGYPSYLGVLLKKFADRIFEDLPNGLKELIDYDPGFEATLGIHGDEEYVYVLDCRDKTIKCFSRGLNDSFENCFKAEREVIIPK